MNAKQVLVALRRITRAIDLHSKRLERSAGLTVPQLLVLDALAEQGSLSVSEIARQVNLSQGTVTSLLDRLETKVFVRRTRGEADRRRVDISLTDAGRSTLASAPALLQDAFIERFDDLEDWEQKMLTAAVERIAGLMDAESVDASPILQVGDIVDPDKVKADEG